MSAALTTLISICPFFSLSFFAVLSNHNYRNKGLVLVDLFADGLRKCKKKKAVLCSFYFLPLLKQLAHSGSLIFHS